MDRQLRNNTKLPKDDYLFRLLNLAGLESKSNHIKALWAATAVFLGLLFAVACFLTLPELTVVGFLLGITIGAAGFALYIRHLSDLRQIKLAQQLPSVVGIMTCALKAGSSLEDAFQIVAETPAEPIRSEFRKGLDSLRTGTALPIVLSEMSSRIQARDFETLIQGIKISHTIQANLADTMTIVNEAIQEEGMLRNRFSLLTKPSKHAGSFFCLLPYGLYFIAFLFSPGYIAKSFDSAVARLMLAILVVWELVGFWLLMKMNTLASNRIFIQHKNKVDHQPKEKDFVRWCKSRLLDFFQRMGEFIQWILPRLDHKNSAKPLTELNYRTAADLDIYLGIKAIFFAAIVCLGIVSAAAKPALFFWCLSAAVCSWYILDFFLASRAQERQIKALRELPSILNLLMLCIQTGLSLFPAVTMVSRESKSSCPILSLETSQLITNLNNSDQPASAAIREMGQLCGVEEIINIGNVLIASKNNRSDVNTALKQQLGHVLQQLEKATFREAATIPIKTIAMIVIFVLPLILYLLLAPSLMTVIIARNQW